MAIQGVVDHETAGKLDTLLQIVFEPLVMQVDFLAHSVTRETGTRVMRFVPGTVFLAFDKMRDAALNCLFVGRVSC